jgi:prolyl 4-hydroxylase
MPLQVLGDRKSFFVDHMMSCIDEFGDDGERCVTFDIERIQLNIQQPQSMQNYTELGFKKIKAPPHLFNMIKEFWEKNKDSRQVEQYGKGNPFT